MQVIFIMANLFLVCFFLVISLFILDSLNVVIALIFLFLYFLSIFLCVFVFV